MDKKKLLSISIGALITLSISGGIISSTNDLGDEVFRDGVITCSQSNNIQEEVKYHWESIGPYGGDRFEVHIHPDNHEILYVVGHGGVHKSINAAERWESVCNQEMQGSFLSFAFHPDNPEWVYTASTLTGVFESKDGAQSWQKLDNGMPSAENRYPPISSISFDEEGYLYAAHSKGVMQIGDITLPRIYRYDFKKDRWAQHDKGLPDTGDRGLFSRGADDALWLSLYGGGCFEHIDGKWESRGLKDFEITIVAPDPVNPDRLYAGTQDDWVYVTDNRGKTWECLPLPEILKDTAEYPLIYDIAIDPNNTDIVVISCMQSGGSIESPLFKVEEHQISAGGKLIYNPAKRDYLIASFSPDQVYSGFRMTFDPYESYDDSILGRRSRVIYQTSGGLHCVTKIDGHKRTHPIEGINGVYLNEIFLSEGGIYFGAGEQGIVADLGDTYGYWPASNDATIYTWSIAEDYHTEGSFYYGTGNPAWTWPHRRGLYRMTMDGMMRSESDDRPKMDQILSDTGIWEIVTFTEDPDLIYLGTQNDGFLISINGKDFIEMNEGLKEKSVYTISAEYDGAIFAGTRTSDGEVLDGNLWGTVRNEKGDLYIYDEDRKCWESLGIDHAVYGIARYGLEMMCATSEGVCASLDGGVSWSGCSTFKGYACADVVYSAGCFYVGVSGRGVFRTNDLGSSWTDVTGDLPNFFIDDMLADPNNPGIIMVATLGSSGFVLED